jgi:hypothetical protein
MPPTIDALYAYILVDEAGGEQVPAIEGRPLLGADRVRVQALWREIVRAPELRGKTITLMKFNARTVISVLRPAADPPRRD